MLLLFFKITIFILIDFGMIFLIGPLSLLFFSLANIIKNILRINNKNNDMIVVLIHGSGVKGWQWIVVENYLSFYDIPYKTVNYYSSQKIDKSCQDVADQLKELDSKNIILIGQSLGGLIARTIADKIKANVKVKLLFLINTPQKGVIVINWLDPCASLSLAACDLRYGSKFIMNLPNVPNDCEVHEIVGKNDFIRPEHAIVYGKNVYMSYFGHYYSAVNPYLWIKYIIPIIKKNC